MSVLLGVLIILILFGSGIWALKTIAWLGIILMVIGAAAVLAMLLGLFTNL